MNLITSSRSAFCTSFATSPWAQTGLPDSVNLSLLALSIKTEVVTIVIKAYGTYSLLVHLPLCYKLSEGKGINNYSQNGLCYMKREDQQDATIRRLLLTSV